MIQNIVNKVVESNIVKKNPYVESIMQSIAIAVDAKKILGSSTPIGAVKIIACRFAKPCMPPELLLTDKCIMFLSRLFAPAATGANPLVANVTISAAKSIVKDL